MQRTFTSFKGNIFCSFMTGVTCVYHSRLSSFSLSVCLFPLLIVRGLLCCQLYAICNIGLNLLFHTIIIYKLMNKIKSNEMTKTKVKLGQPQFLETFEEHRKYEQQFIFLLLCKFYYLKHFTLKLLRLFCVC